MRTSSDTRAICSGSLDAIDQSSENTSSMEDESSSAVDQSIAVDHKMTAESKFDVRAHGVYTEARVELTRLQVSFPETVTVINSSTEIHRKGSLLARFVCSLRIFYF